MFKDSVSIDILLQAYYIAENYLQATGQLSSDVIVHQRLLDSIIQDFLAGKQSKLLLANMAIARFEKMATWWD